MPNLAKSSALKILGRNYNNASVTSLRKDLDIREGSIKNSNDIVRAVRQNVDTEKVIYNKTSGEVEKISLHDKPLVIRQFLDLNKVNKDLRNNIITNEPYETTNRRGDEIVIFDKTREFDDTDKIKILVKVRFFIQHSQNVFGDPGTERHVTFNYTGDIGDMKFKNIFIKLSGVAKPQYSIFDQALDLDVNTGAEFEEIIPDISAGERFILKDMNKFVKAMILALRQADYIALKLDLFIFSIEGVTTNKSTFDLNSMKLRKVNYDNLSVNIFNELIDIKDNSNNCVVTYLSSQYKTLKVKDYFKDCVDGVTTSEIVEFCKENKIKCIAYDRESNVIGHNNIKKSVFKPLIFIAFNNHIYPIKNKLLIKQVTEDTTYKYIDNDKLQNDFLNILQNKIIPGDVKISVGKNSKPSIVGYIHNNVSYHSNKDYDDCKQILGIFGYDDKMTDKINKYNLFSALSGLYNIPSYSSFCPFLNNYTIGGFLYNNVNILKSIDVTKTKTKDKNKAYGDALYNIDYIYVTDIKYDTITKNPTDPTNIEYIYVIEPKVSSVLIPMTGYYTGEDLEYFDNEGLAYTKLYEIEARRIENKYKSLINDFYTKTSKLKLNDPGIIKNIVNIFIGKLERGEHTKNRIEFRKICNKDEASKTGNTFINIDGDYCATYDEVKEYEINTKKMISIQIKNRCRRTLYEEMKRLKIKTADIVQMNTDSFTYVKTKDNLNDKVNINEKNFKSWKIIPYKKLSDHVYEVTNETIDLDEFIRTNKNKNMAMLGYAGSGKTRSVIKVLLPQLNKRNKLYATNNKKDYIIITPSHFSLQYYRKINEPCAVTQTYFYGKPLESHIKTIIVDEIGLCGTQSLNFLYKCSKMGIRVIAYGDFAQLSPAENAGKEDRKLSTHFINLLFGKIERNTDNYRNNFTTEYYDKLINAELDLVKEIEKHSEKDYKNVEAIICYRNDTVDLYNNLVLKDKNIDMETKGCSVICKTNELRSYNIYNNYILEVVGTNDDDETIKLKDEIETYEIPLSKYRKIAGNKKPYFKPAYARTIYSLQGATLKNYYSAPEDINFFNNGAVAYTIISRKSK
jgi:hypothetical protein